MRLEKWAPPETMGTGASKYRVEEVRNASSEALTNAFAKLSDSEQQRVMAALETVTVSADPKACCSFKIISRLRKLFSTFI